MSRHPETIRLFLELTESKLFWWEPVDGTDIYLVELSDGAQHWVRNIGGNITHWRNKCPQ